MSQTEIGTRLDKDFSTYYSNGSSNDDIVITGVSGRYPESDNIDEFAHNLFNRIDMVTESDRRWPVGLYGLPKRNGTLKDITKFDAQFFGVNPKQADQMDPQLRLLLEVTYEAIFDSGLNPNELKATRTGVFIGASSSEALYAYSHDPSNLSGYSMTGCATSMIANRLSFYFDFKGPSYTIDTACSSSLVALDAAVQSLKSGYCDFAIVGGVNLVTRPQTSLQFQRLGMLSPDGMCKSFDSTGKGYVRSETISVVLLQRISTSRKFYAKILNSRVNTDGAKEQGITFPSGQVQANLLKEIYSESKIDPNQVVYVEAHGTGTKAGDPQELNSITEVFTKNRTTPLFIGSTKSNMGHPEPASGLAALSKILISIQSGSVPGNLHFNEPNPDIRGLVDGKLKVVDRNLKFNGGLIALNSFGFGGANAHLLIQPNSQILLNKKGDRSFWNKTDLVKDLESKPRLFQFSSRTEQGLNEVFDLVEKDANDLALHCILEPNSLTSHSYRGYTILNSQNQIREVQRVTVTDRPIYYVFSGMGTQWEGMGKDLMKIEIFRKSIEKSAQILRPYNLDLIDIIMSSNSKTYERTLNSFVGIASIQIGLVDCLNQVGIKPDGILGHSVGELGCAYADKSFSHEETLLAAYYRGKCIEEACLPPGAMAAVGLTWEECKIRCPSGVVPACHNSRDTVTISGPKDSVQNFVQQLKSEGIFAKEVDSSNVAFHSYYMNEIADNLKQCLDKVIKSPKPRSSKWISSSIPQDKWTTELAKYSSADYHVNNLCSAVLFQEALKHVPENALTIEIAPHALLQAILKRSLSKENVFVGLMNKNASNQIEHLMTALGRVYLHGVNLKSTRLLIPDDENVFPVPVQTRFLSPLVKWDHSQTWNVPKYQDFVNQKSGQNTEANSFMYTIDLDNDNSYISGHQIDGRVLYPATGYLCLVWESLAKMKQLKTLGMVDEKNLDLPKVLFENVEIHRATILKASEVVNFQVSVMLTGEFELSENGNLIVSGSIKILEEDFNNEKEQLEGLEMLAKKSQVDFMVKEEIYKELRLRGYEYKNEFQPIEKSDLNGTCAQLKWNSKWIPFLDAMLQMNVLGQKRGLLLPTRIRSIRIDPKRHLDLVNNSLLPAVYDPFTKTTLSGSVEIIGLHATVAPKRHFYQPTILERVEFVPYFDEDQNNNPSQDLGFKRDHEAYVLECSRLIQKLINGEDVSQISSKGTFGKYLTGENLNELGLLKSINEDSILKSHQTTTLKSLIDVALENCVIKSKNQKVRILEISDSITNWMIPRISQFSRTHPQLCDQIELGYVQINRLTETEAQYFEEVNKNLLIQIEKFDWNLMKDRKLSLDIPSSLGKFDIVVLNESFSSFVSTENYKTWLETVVPNISKDFVVVSESFDQAFNLKTLVHRLRESKFGHKLTPLSQVSLDQVTLPKFSEVSRKSSTSTLLISRLKKSYQQTKFISVDETSNFEWLDQIKSSLNDPTIDRVFLMSQSLDSTGIVGMVNCLRKEFNGEKIRCVLNTEISTEILNNDLVMNVFKDDRLGSMRHVFDSEAECFINSENDLYDLESSLEQTCDNSFVNSLQRGDLSSLKWLQSPKPHVKDTQVVCNVAYAALNFRDIMLATGKLSPEAIPNYFKMQDTLLGMEFTGEVNGKNYMGMVSARGLSTQVVVDKNYLWEVPSTWSLAEASTVPVAYSTAYYALCVRGNLKKHDSVLIHAGSGAVGQAAISIALSYQCKVFVTVSSNDKKEYLKTRFPSLTDNSFSNSRDLSFEKHVMSQTHGCGVDLVLNSLSDDKLQASLRVLAQHGRFLEIGKFDLNKNSNLGMSVFLKNISFHGILLDSLFDCSENVEWKLVYNMLAEGIKTGVVRPLNTTIFEKSEIEQAFRYMAQGKHIGKVLIKCTEPVQVLPKVWFNPTQSYIITGGLGGFGLELAQWLIERGVRNLVLTSRTGIKTGYQTRKVQSFIDEFDAKVQVLALDVKNESECLSLIEQSRDLCESKNIGGIFHLAALLEDGLLENQTPDRFRRVIDIKLQGAVNLDKFTRDVMDDQSYFVVFSSVTSGRGNLGQSNYGYANSGMERVCEMRKRAGKNALAIQWGAIGDVGLVVESAHMNGSNETIVGGTYPQRIYVCLKTLEYFLLKQNSVIWSSFVPAFDGIKDKKKVKSNDEKNLLEVVANILGIKDLKQVRNEQLTLAEMGLDSLMSVEIKQILEQNFSMNLNMKEIQSLTFSKLRTMSNEEKPSLNESKTNTVKKELKMIMPLKVIEKLNQIEGVETPMFIIHPIEGHVEMLKEFAGLVNRPVYGIQYTQQAIEIKSLKDLAVYYWSEIEKITNKQIHLCGYSFGASVAFEMGLERNNRIRSLTLLDGSHSYVNVQVNAYKSKLQLNDLSVTESEALYTFYQQFDQVQSRTEFISALLKMENFDQRVRYVVKSLMEDSCYKFEENDLELGVRAFVVKLFMSFEYEPKEKLKFNEILLIKSEFQTKLIVKSEIQEALGNDFGLSQVFDGKINIKIVSGDHRTFLEGQNAKKVAELINQNLN